MMSKRKPAPGKIKPPLNKQKKPLKAPLNYEAIINWAVWSIYSIVVLYAMSCHEPWRDEAQSWLLPRDNSIMGLLKCLPNEGHPPAWYLLLMPFAKLGFPYFTANVVNTLLSIGGAWLILFRSRMPLYLRMSLVFSYYMIFEYGVIARNYSIVVLVMFAIVAVYDDRFKRPLLYGALVFLLFQTNVLAFSVGGALGLVFFTEMIAEKRFAIKNFLGLGLMAAGALATAVLLLSAGMHSEYTAKAADKYVALTAAFGEALLFSKTATLGLPLFVILVAALFRKPLVMVFLGIGLAGYCYLIVYKFQGTVRHHGFVVFFLASAYSLAVRYPPLKKFNKLQWIETGGAVLFSLVICYHSIKGFTFFQEDIGRNFSDSKNAADFIIRNQLYKYTIAGHQSFAASAIVPYLPGHKTVWYADQQRYGTYQVLDTLFYHNYKKYNADYAANIVEKDFKDQDSVILLLNMPLKYPPYLAQWELIYHTAEKPIKVDEAYCIYRHRKVQVKPPDTRQQVAR